MYDNMLIMSSYGGIYAWSMTNGDLLWSFIPNASYATPYGVYPFYGGATVAGGVVYCGVDEHTPNAVLYPNYDLYALNATTGQLLWNVPVGYAPGPIVADGILVDLSSYDGNLYAMGRGNTATTVSATPGLGNAITIQGSVTDQSPGETNIGVPIAGTPAVSDASMQQWMDYLFFQMPEPLNTTGVPVTLTYTDPNHNTYTLGTVTTDINGRYGYDFTPTIPGLYTVTATFAGSQSYYASSSDTCFTYAAPTTTATVAPTATPTTVADMYFVPAIAGLFVLIIIVLIVVVLLMLRKKP